VRALQMYMVYVSLLLGALNKLPLKLPRRGVGRRRANSGNASLAQAAITFDDVAGVDEAKEELAEIVVRCALLRRLFRL
jgi:cell division protease FtsH